MTRRIVIIQGHPDPSGKPFGYALADAYANGARDGGHELRMIHVANLDFPLLRTKDDFYKGAPPAALREAHDAVLWADHLVIFYPLWLGSMPALLKGFLEQLFRPIMNADDPGSGKVWKKILKGKSARIVVTMGMPAFFYRWYFRAHGLKNLERNILRFIGVGPIKESLFGLIENVDDAKRRRWLEKMRALGRAAQ